MKTALLVIGFVAAGIAAADLLTGNNEHRLLPAMLGDHLDQQTDLILGGVGAAALWYAFAKL